MISMYNLLEFINMKISDLSIAKRLALGFSIIILLILAMASVIYFSNRRVGIENSKQRRMESLLDMNVSIENKLLEFIQTGNNASIDSANVYIEKFNRELQLLKPMVIQKNYGIVVAIENDLKELEKQIERLKNSSALLAETSTALESESAKALALAARVMGGEVSKGVQQFLNIRILEKSYLITRDESILQKWTTEIDDNTRLALKLGLVEIAQALEVYKKSYLVHVNVKKELINERNKVQTGVNQIQGLIQKGVRLSSDLLNNAAKNGLRAILITIMIILALSVLIGYLITQSITNLVNTGVRLADNISSGKLLIQHDNNSDRKDELGKLSRALAGMSDKLKEVISTIHVSTTHIVSASDQLSITSQQVSQGASEQASSAEEVSASMEQMVANIQNNAENAKQAELIALNSVESIRKGYDATSYAVDSMKKIAEKVSIIGDIAFQTNILALNAAVEAARAGEHGRGFAVVAAEVRKLAERSRLAADEINHITRDGVEIADKAGQLLSGIVPEIEKTARLVQEIAAASIEQNAGADQVNSAMQQLNQVTQQNAAASEEMASSAEELNSQAQQMIGIVSFFDFGQKETLLKSSHTHNDTKHVANNSDLIKNRKDASVYVKHEKKSMGTGLHINLNHRIDDDNYENF